MLIDLSAMPPKVLIPQPYYPNGDYDLWMKLGSANVATRASSTGEARFHQTSPSQIEMVKGCILTAHTDAVYAELRVYSGIVDPHPWVFALTPFPVVQGALIYLHPSPNGLPLLSITPGLGFITPTAPVSAPAAVEMSSVSPGGIPTCVKCGIPNEYQTPGYTCWKCRRKDI